MVAKAQANKSLARMNSMDDDLKGIHGKPVFETLLNLFPFSNRLRVYHSPYTKR
jgi:hypothetical protein